MFHKATLTISQPKMNDGTVYFAKHAGGEYPNWLLTIDIYYDNHGNNSADIILAHRSLPSGYRTFYDQFFRNATDLGYIVDKLFNNWRNDDLIYNNHEKRLTHREIQSFISDSFQNIDVQYFTARSPRVK